MAESVRRVLTALIAAPLVVGIAYLGGWPFALLVGAIALAAQWEVYAIARESGLRPSPGIGLGLGALVVAGTASPIAWPVAFVLSVLTIALGPFLLDRDRFLENLCVTYAGVLYPTGFLASLVLLRAARGPAVDDLGAFVLVLMTLFLVWATDIFAYYTGKSLGRRKLAPSISPNKTWEGAIGGAAAALLVAAGFRILTPIALSWIDTVVVALLCGVVGQLGDLVQSQVKRSADVKDAGSVLPGHGGLLDRFDAMAVAAPLVWFYLTYVARIFG